jgi:hypothetical protein
LQKSTQKRKFWVTESVFAIQHRIIYISNQELYPILFVLSHYLVFLTDRFIKKVAGYNAADNCRKGFKYAALKNKIFIAVGMEEVVKDQRAWPSIIGLHLGSCLYIDASGDLTNPGYMNHVVSEICKAASLLDVGAIPATHSSHHSIQWQCEHKTTGEPDRHRGGDLV